MTVKKTETQLRKAAMVKAARNAIRTRHSILADAELNEILPELERAFDQSVQQGVLPGDEEIASIVQRMIA